MVSRKGTLRFAQEDLDIETALEAALDDFEVQFTLAGETISAVSWLFTYRKVGSSSCRVERPSASLSSSPLLATSRAPWMLGFGY
jgi:hypothetical protein